MLKAYLDRGAKNYGRSSVMCVGAALFKPTPYKQFTRSWERMLREWDASSFHATDFYNGGGEFQRSRPDGSAIPGRQRQFEHDSRFIPMVIGEHVHRLFVVSLKVDEYEDVAPMAWRNRFGGVHQVAIQAVIDAIGHWADKARFSGEIAYVYETGDEEESQVSSALGKRHKSPKHRKHCRMASKPIGVEKGKARGLEVSDFIAWHWNKFYADTLADRSRHPRKDFSALMQTMRLNRKKIETYLMTGDALEKFLISHGCHRTSGRVSDVSS